MSGTDTADDAPPNVLVVICDDLGYGDLGCHGNTVVETPALDGLHDEGTRLTRFYGGPVCSPARASLMTGRWHYRTGVTDTYKGRSMMAGDEVTVAERLSEAGYRTGLFGKWHLGDNYPMRPHDQGFEEALYHQGGGLCQPAGEPDETYFDPLLWHNGQRVRTEGFCTDVYTDAAVEFIEGGEEPFFAYVATNAPHTPLQAPDADTEPYLETGCSEARARFYGMVSNIDANVGRLLAALEETGAAEDTVVVFTADHGPALHQDEAGRFRCGRRGGKGSVYEGGVRVPCFVRWPGLAPGDCDQLAHFVDLLPTLLPACGASPPSGRTVDGVDLRPALAGEGRVDDRRIFLQWHRGDAPDLYRNCAVVGERFKLVDGAELYDLAADPGENRNVAAAHPDVVADLRAAYEAWFADVSATRGYEPPRIVVGTGEENPTRLTRQEAQCLEPGEGWRSETARYAWELAVPDGGTFDVELRFRSREQSDTTAHIDFGDADREQPVTRWQSSCRFEAVSPGAGETRLDAWVETGRDRFGVRYAVLDRTDL